MKYIGYGLIALGSFLLTVNGFGLDTWQWWIISFCYIGGCYFGTEDV